MSLEDIRKALADAKYNKDTPTKSFVLYEDVQQIWAGEKLEQFLWTHDPGLTPSEINTVRETLLRTISILATIVPLDWLGWSRFREMFLPADDTLADFRRDKHALEFKMEHLAADSFLGGDPLAQLFMNFRWIYFPEVLKGRKHAEYEAERRIPLYQDEYVLREGVFGTVTKEKIPPNHIILSHLSDHLGIPDAPHPVELVVARKSFHKPNHFVEVNALKSLRESLSTHKRIISYLAIFSIHNQWNIIMPWADMDLEDFLVKGYQSMEPTECLLKDLIHETRKFAAAIHFLHEHLHLESEWPEFHDQAMCHMDIKPKNILVFKHPGSSTGIWRITDFGISHVAHLRQSEDSTRDSGYTHAMRRPSLRMGEYQAPDDQVQLRSDIWSFGCILTRVFALGLNPASLQELDKQRKEMLIGGRRDDCFHVGMPPALHPSIESWIYELPNRYSASPQISSTGGELQEQPDNQPPQNYNPGFLEEMQQVLRSMLQIDFERRPSAREVRSALHNLQTINIYTSQGMQPIKPSMASWTPGYLAYAIEKNRMRELDIILSQPIDVEECLHDGERPLIYAINLANATVINKLSDHQRTFHQKSLDVRTCSSGGDTPLHLAVRTGNPSTVKAVIDASIPPPNPEFAAFLNELSSERTALMQAAFLGHADVVSLLLSHGADYTICTGEHNWNCLHFAVIHESSAKEDVIKAFNKKMGFDQLPPGAPEATPYETPLMHHLTLALQDFYGYPNIDPMWTRKFHALLDGGADLNRKFDAGTPLEMSPLEVALMEENKTITRILLDAKATPRATLPINYNLPSWLHGELKDKARRARTAQPSLRR